MRFQGLNNVLNNRILGTDAEGNVTWRDISTFGDPSSNWLIDGNSNITDANFLGSKSGTNVPIIFKVNGNQRVQISKETISGSRKVSQVEIGKSSDENNLTNLFVWSRDVVGFSLPFFISSDISGMSFNNSSGQYNTLGRLLRLNQGSNNTNGGNDFYDIGIDNFKDLYFTGHQTPGSLTTLPNKVFTINGFNQNAKVGIKIPWGLQPTADFHTVGTVRHKNLLTAQASPLVIDNLGNVYRSEGRQTGLIDQDINDLQNLVADLQNQITSLQEQLNDCCNNQKTWLDHIPKSEKIKLYQNAPNPFSQITRLRYFIPSTIQTGVIKIYNLSGKELK